MAEKAMGGAANGGKSYGCSTDLRRRGRIALIHWHARTPLEINAGNLIKRQPRVNMQHKDVFYLCLHVSHGLVAEGYGAGNERSVVGSQTRLVLRVFVLLAVAAAGGGGVR